MQVIYSEWFIGHYYNSGEYMHCELAFPRQLTSASSQHQRPHRLLHWLLLRLRIRRRPRPLVAHLRINCAVRHKCTRFSLGHNAAPDDGAYIAIWTSTIQTPAPRHVGPFCAPHCTWPLEFREAIRVLEWRQHYAGRCESRVAQHECWTISIHSITQSRHLVNCRVPDIARRRMWISWKRRTQPTHSSYKRFFY